MGCGSAREVVADAVGHGDLANLTALGVTQDHLTDIRQGHVAGIEDLDTEQLVMATDRPQGTVPVDGSEEVADHDGEAATALRSTQRVDPRVEVAAHPV